MEISLAQVGILLVILSGVARLILLSVPLVRFIQIFDKKIIEGSRLIGALEIPGLKRFIRDEVIFGFVPYLSLIAAVVYFKLDNFSISSLAIFPKIVLFLTLGIWLFLDWWRSFSIYDKLNRLHKETKQVKSITGNVLDGLRFIVHVRGSVHRTVRKLGMRAAVGVVKNRLQRKEKEEGKTPIGIVAISLVDKLISFPEKITGKLTDWAKEDLDGKLKKKFSKYAERTTFQLFFILCWGLLPMFLLVFIPSV